MIATTIGQSVGLEQILNDTLASALQVLEIDGGWVQLLDDDGLTLTLAADRGIPTPAVEEIKRIQTRRNRRGQAGRDARR